MKILGCFKVVPDLDLVADEDWRTGGGLAVDTSYVKPVWNCFDEGALEMMLRLSDLSEGLGVVCELNAFTVGKQKAESFLKTLYALGFSEGIRVCMEEDILFRPECIAEGVANYVRKIQGQDVIMTGIQSSDGSNCKTPYLIAEKLGWPCITHVIDAEPAGGDCLKVKRQVSGGFLIQTVKTPLVLAAGNTLHAYLRIPTLKARMQSSKKAIVRVAPDDLGMGSVKDGVRPLSLDAVDRRRNTVLLGGDTPEEKAGLLYENYLKGRMEIR